MIIIYIIYQNKYIVNKKIIDGKVENLGKSYRSYKEVVDNINNIYKAYSKDWNYIHVEHREDDE